MSDTDYRIWCIFEGNDEEPFHVNASSTTILHGMKKLIKERLTNALREVAAMDLILWKPTDPILVKPASTLSTRLRDLGSDLSTFAEMLDPVDSVGEVFPNRNQTSPSPQLDVIIRLPAHFSIVDEDQRAFKRPRLNDAELQQSPPRLTPQDTENKMMSAFEPFDQYIKYLAQGKLDGYLNSNLRGDKISVPEMDIPNDPNLLLNGLGSDAGAIEELFITDTVHLFNTSGSGKTRLALEGLCHNWGFYISCRSRDALTSGSADFEEAIKMLKTMSTWNQANSTWQNTDAADRVFSMLVCARLFVFRQFLDQIPSGTELGIARRRWVLVQSLPPTLESRRSDIFVEILWSLRRADTGVLHGIARDMFSNITAKSTHLFPNEDLFVVIDEAQVAANILKNCFPSNTNPSVSYSVLHELYRSLHDNKLFTGIVVAGTGLSSEIMERSLGATAAKPMRFSVKPIVFTGNGVFTEPEQEAYIRRLSEEVFSDRRVLERIRRWFIGRHRLTASLLELYLYSPDAPRHRVLSEFVKRLTGFTITDAIELEDEERPIPKELFNKIRRFGPLISEKHLFEEPKRQTLVLVLVNVLMRWITGSQPITVQGHMRELIDLGVGYLQTVQGEQFDPEANHPVYINEPLVILSLSSKFAKQTWTKRSSWMSMRTSTAPTKSAFGDVFEETMLFVLMEKFGGKFTALGDVFRFGRSSSLGEREATLVSLMRIAEDKVSCHEASWRSGCSDRFGFKARSPKDVIAYLRDPRGIPFLFPDVHMGPDLIAFFQDKKTQELIILLLQAKARPNLDSKTWLEALESITPDFFYTVIQGGKRTQYAPVLHPDLAKDVSGLLDDTLGPAIHKIGIEGIRSRLRSANKQPTALPTRETPRYLRIIVSPDDQQEHRLKAEHQGDVGILKWDMVKEWAVVGL